MRQTSLFKKFIHYCTLNVLGMIGLSCYILADTYFIAKGLGARGLAALNLAIPVYSLIHGCGLMLGMGGGTKYSIFKGQNARENSNRLFTSTLFLWVILSAVFLLTGLLFSGNIAVLLGADEDVYSMTRQYMQVILLFSPCFLLNELLLCFVRNDGEPRLAMLAMLGGSFSNILLDYVFIFPLGMGMFGAVLATGLAPVVSMGILSAYFFKKKNQFHPVRVTPDIALIKSTLSLGFPSFISEVSSGVVILIFNMIILGLLGNVGVAAYGVIANLSLVMVSVYTGIAQGVQPLAGHSYGRGDFTSIWKIARYALAALFFVSLTIFLVVFFFAEPITALFNSQRDPLLQEIASSGLKWYFTAAPFVGFNIILAMFFTATERPLPAHLVSLSRGLILIIPMAFALSAFLGITGVWLAFPVTEGLVALSALLFCLRKNVFSDARHT